MQRSPWSHSYNIKRDYGMLPSEYRALFESQGGACAICGSTETENKKRLAIDHCHISGIIRGLLCDRCNRSFGFAKDSSEILRKMADYIELHRNRIIKLIQE